MASAMPVGAVPHVLLKVQFRNEQYQASVPEYLWHERTAHMSKLIQIVCEADPRRMAVASTLKAFTFEKAEWTSENIEALLRYKLIVLAEDVGSIPAERRTEWQSLPAVRILTEPHAMPAQAGHLPPVYTYPGEFIENSVRASRGFSRNSIYIRFYLPSEGSNAGASEQDYLAFGDTACGMVLETIKSWATLAADPTKMAGSADTAGNVPYFLDGNFSCFGVGSKYAAFLMGHNILMLTKAFDPAGKSEILETRVTKEALHRQEDKEEDRYKFPAATRQPHDVSSRTPEELQHPDMMKLINEFDKQGSGTLFIITDLRQDRMAQLKSRPFQTLTKYMSGTYFYLTVPGSKPAHDRDPATVARANFMHGPGVGNKPWPNWPEEPETEGDLHQEDIMHALARITLHSTFEQPLQGVPQVHGSKFVFGVVLDGAVANGANDTVKGDSDMDDGVFVLIYLHYLPNLRGEETKPRLGLLPGVRWLPFWKGRLMQLPDLTALLPIMKKGWSGSQNKYKDLITNRVVGQMFLPGVVGVDRFKTKFEGPINEQLEKLPPESYYNVDEDKLYSSKSFGSRVFPTDNPNDGMTPVRKTVLEQNLKKWTLECSQQFDDQWAQEDPDVQNSTTEFKAYKTLQAKHKKDVYRSGEYMLASQLGINSLSRYRRSEVAPASRTLVTQTSMLGKLEYIKINNGKGISEAVAVLAREPAEQFGRELFDFSIYKLQRPDESTQEAEIQKAVAAEPKHVCVSVTGSRQQADGSHLVVVPAHTDLPVTRVDIANDLPESRRPGGRVTHWTSATNGSRKNVEQLRVRQRVFHSGGAEDGQEVFCAEADLLEEEQEKCFMFNRTTKLQLPRPGLYSAEFTVTIANRGPAASKTIVSKEKLTYQATLGALRGITLAGVPTTPQHLGSVIPTMYLDCLDEFGNHWHSPRAPKVEFTSGQLILSNESTPRWEQAEPGKPCLRLPAVVIKPGSMTQGDFSAPNRPVSVKCSVSLHGLKTEFTLRILPGLPTGLTFLPLPAWFSLAEAEPSGQLENKQPCPAFTLQLCDGFGFRTTPMAAQDSVEIKVASQPGGVPPLVMHNKVAFVQNSGSAVFNKLKLSLPGVTQVRPVDLQARVKSTASHHIPSLAFKAKIQPSTCPFKLCLYQDAGLQHSLALTEEAGGAHFVLEQTAGKQVEQVFITVLSENGAVIDPVDVTEIKLDRCVAPYTQHTSTAVLVQCSATLKSPNSIEDTKDVEVSVSGDKWVLKAAIKLKSVSGPRAAWAFDLGRSHAVAKNGEDISGRIKAYMVDELNNACSLPADILTCPPQLSILAQSAQAGPTAQAAGFLSSGATGHKSQTYHGRWEQTPNHALGMSDLALVGPPGQVHLIMSGGCTVGATLKQGLLPLELQLGPIARWQTCGWPSGTQASRMLVNELMLTAYDVGDNVVDVPKGALRVSITGDSAQVRTRTGQQLVASREHDLLKVAPFKVVAITPGDHAMQLTVRRQVKQQWVALPKMPIDLEEVTTVWSDRVVKAIEFWPSSLPGSSVVAGTALPPIRVVMKTEDGKPSTNPVQFISSMTARLGCPDGSTLDLLIAADDGNHALLACTPPRDYRLGPSGQYQVTVGYKEANAESLGLDAEEASLEVSQQFQVVCGTGTALHLTLPHVELHKCFNAGTDAERTVIPAARLRIVDSQLNLVSDAANTASVAVSVLALGLSQQPARAYLQLNLSSIEIPLATGYVDFGPIIVSSSQQVQLQGLFALTLSVSSSSGPALTPVNVEFELIEASQLSIAVKNAMAAAYAAEAAVRDCRTEVSQKQHQEGLLRQLFDGCVQAAQSHLSSVPELDVSPSKLPSIKQLSQQALAAVRQSRTARHRHPMPSHHYDQLMATSGVVGFMSELVFVEDETDARLLSWASGSKLDLLVVTDAKARFAVPQRLPGFRWQMLVLSLASAPSPSKPLPHSGARNAQMFQADVQQFANLVTAHIPPERMPGSSPVQRKGAQDKLVDCVCRDMLRMETETSATEYMENVKQVLHRRCPSILCADNGAMVQSSGIVGGDASHRAPQLTSQLSSCFGQLPREQTLEYKFSSTAVELLQQVADLRPGLRHAQMESNAATSHLKLATAQLEDCRKVLAEAERSAAEFHQTNLPHLTGAINEAGGSNMPASPEQQGHNKGTKRKAPATVRSPGLNTPQRPTSRRRSEVSPNS